MVERRLQALLHLLAFFGPLGDNNGLGKKIVLQLLVQR